MKRTFTAKIFIFVFSIILCSLHVYAEDSADIIEVFKEDNDLQFYICGIKGEIEKINSYVSSVPMKDINYYQVGTNEVSIKTLFLIDGSLSIKKEDKEHFEKLLNSLIDSKGENESFAIATFGEEPNYVCDYITDRWELMKALESIKYSKQKSYLTDIVSSLIREFSNSDDGAYKRIVIFSDGGDDNVNGITVNELNVLLQDSPYSIFTIGCDYESNSDELKDLFAISRLTKADSFLFTEDSDLKTILQTLNTAKEYIAVRVTLPDAIRDGGIKNIEISIETSVATYTVNRDIRVDMIKLEDGTTEVEKDIGINQEDQEYQENEDLSNQNNFQEAIDKNQEESIEVQDVLENDSRKVEIKIKDNASDITKYLIMTGISVLPIIILILISAKRKKNKKKKQPLVLVPSQTDKAINNSTVILKDYDIVKKEETGTQLLFQNNTSWYLQLKDINNNRIFEKSFTDEVIIGRDAQPNNIVINYDTSVSKSHCRIFVRDSRVTVEDLQSANHTYINEIIVNKDTDLVSGDIIKLGRVKLEVRIEKK